ncbi:MAG TPA: hypothetical protein VFG07_06765 [Thermoplasmata archaeon]|nr:hypothetical protein [Thermoplasmata archaeon]
MSYHLPHLVGGAISAHPAWVALAVLLPLAVSGTLGAAVGPTSVSPGLGLTLVRAVNGTLQSGSYVGTHLAGPFFDIVFTDVSTPTSSLLHFGSYLNSTPIGVMRFGGSGEGYDPTAQVNYEPPSSGTGRYVASHEQLWNLTWFKSWCLSRTPHCSWLTYLPGEENDTRAAVHFARWYHQVLGFAPTFWEFGNEPSQWTHFGKNLTNWSTTDALPPSALGYATMARSYIAAVSALYPKDQFLGLEAACACNAPMTSSTAQLNAHHLSAMAYHSYPSSSTSSIHLSAFYALLTSTGGIPSSSARYRSAVAASCSACTNLPVELGEYQAGPFNAFSPFAATYAGAPFMAASIIQALQANLSALTVYNLDSLFDAASSTPTFEGLLYQRILANLTMGNDYLAPVKVSGLPGLYTLLIKNGTREALMVVNTNLVTALNLHVASIYPSGVKGEVWSWSSGAGTPTHQAVQSLPSSYSVGPQGILLVANY